MDKKCITFWNDNSALQLYRSNIFYKMAKSIKWEKNEGT